MSHIICPECSFVLGEVSEFIMVCKNAYYKKEINEKKINLDKLKITPDVSKPIGFIFDAVGATNMCCRMHLLGMTDFDNIYK